MTPPPKLTTEQIERILNAPGGWANAVQDAADTRDQQWIEMLAEQEPVAHLKKLLDAMHRESNAKHNLNEWLRASPAFAQRASQAEAEWVVAVKHLVAMQMDAEKYAAGHTAPQPAKQPLTEPDVVKQVARGLGK